MSVPGEAKQKYTHVVSYNIFSSLSRIRLLIILSFLLALIFIFLISPNNVSN